MRNSNTELGGNGQGASQGTELSTSGATPGAYQTPSTGLVADIEDLLKSTTSLTGEDLARAKARLMERVTAARESLTKFRGAADDFVRERPWQSVGIAAVAGIVFGLLLARRS